MRQLFVVLFAVLLMVGGGEDLFAKGSRSSSRSSSKSSFKSTPKPKTVQAPKKTIAPKKTRTDQKSTLKKSPTSTKPKAVSANKMDRKQTKAMKSKNTAAAKKYGNKANAAKAYKTDEAKKHSSYTSPNPPSTRPASIPQTVVVAGYPSCSVGYYPFGGGLYGYGYMDPLTRMYIAVSASQMIANDMALESAGYGHYGPTGAPVVYRSSNGVYILFSIIGICVIIAIIVAVKREN